MNKIIIGLVLVIAFATTANAESKAEVCSSMETFAGEVMDARQVGVGAKDAYRVVNNIDGAGEELKETMRVIIKLAYKVPQYDNDVEISLAVDAFKKMIFSNCVDNL